MITESSLVHSPLGQSGCDGALSLELMSGGALHVLGSLILPRLAAGLILEDDVSQKLWSV